MIKSLFLSIFLLLNGCFFYEPSQVEVEQAIKEHLQSKILHAEDGNILGQVIIEAMGIDSIQFHRIEKVNCESSNLNSATCEVAFDYTIGKQDNAMAILMGTAGRHEGVETYRFVKISKGWIVAN
jgi:hypothetical protein